MALLIVLIVVFFTVNYVCFTQDGDRSPFECGILLLEVSRRSFSFYFFYFIILFLLFDVELCCLLPLVGININEGIIVISFILFSTLIEINDGALSWVLGE